MRYRYSAKELRELAMVYGRTMRGEDYDGRKMEARRCPLCATYEVIDTQAKGDNTVLSCKCDI